MKQVLKAAGGLLILAHIAIGILIVTIIGCGETEEETITADLTGDTATAVSTIGEMKVLPDAAPGAPSAVPTDGTPYVKSVGYYSDWQLTEKLSGAVAQGKTIFVKIVFSEPMQFKPADDNAARPILYYRVGKEQSRFKAAKHGASGEDFTSGDAKPLQGGTDDYVCKYIVPADASGNFRVEIGKFNADLDGNNLPAFYTHNEQLQLGQAVIEKPTQPTDTVIETPADDTEKEPTQPTDTTPPVVVSITHYNDRTGGMIAEGESVEHNTTVKTLIMLSEPIDPTSVVVTYTTGGEAAQRYSYAAGEGGVHWRGTFRVSGDKKTIRCKQYARKDSFTVTLEEAEDMSGNTLAEPVTTTVIVEPHVVTTAPEPTVPQPPIETPAPPLQESLQQPESIVDLGYTFTLEGETYPGYNPSPELQRILDTHPSAKLPHFIEAVQMEEVIDWTYRTVWKVYPDWETNSISVDKQVAARHKVNAHFGMSRFVSGVLPRMFFSAPDGPLPPHSRYWMKVEYLRLQLEHPDKEEDDLLNLFIRNKNNVVGIMNPNDEY